jgi:FHA domain
MAACPKGHDSTTLDYCDVCGVPLAPSASPAPVPVSAAASPPGSSSVSPPVLGISVESCPVCGAAKTGRFCEEDGYDFLLAPSVSPAPPPSPAAESSAVPGSSGAASAPVSLSWIAVVRPDPAYFEVIKAMGGDDVGTLSFPRFAAERRFPLTGEQMVIGRRSRSRGVHPDIDLVGPPEDPGVSHVHALLVAQPGGAWAIVDLDSANGTYLNTPSSTPVAPNTPIPLNEGDTIYIGAWTALTIRQNPTP